MAFFLEYRTGSTGTENKIHFMSSWAISTSSRRILFLQSAGRNEMKERKGQTRCY